MYRRSVEVPIAIDISASRPRRNFSSAALLNVHRNSKVEVYKEVS